MILIKLYIVGFLFALVSFVNDVKEQTNPELTFMQTFVYVAFDTRHLRYTLKSWFYFIEKLWN